MQSLMELGTLPCLNIAVKRLLRNFFSIGEAQIYDLASLLTTAATRWPTQQERPFRFHKASDQRLQSVRKLMRPIIDALLYPVKKRLLNMKKTEAVTIIVVLLLGLFGERRVVCLIYINAALVKLSTSCNKERSRALPYMYHFFPLHQKSLY